MHAPEVCVKSNAVDEAAAISGQQYGDTGIPVVVECVTQHRSLQRLIHTLLASLHRAAFQQLHRNSFILETVPDVPQLGGNGPDRNCMLDLASRVRKLQQIPEMNAHAMSGRNSLSFNRNVASADEDVGVVPVDKDLFHFRSLDSIS